MTTPHGSWSVPLGCGGVDLFSVSDAGLWRLDVGMGIRRAAITLRGDGEPGPPLIKRRPLATRLYGLLFLVLWHLIGYGPPHPPSPGSGVPRRLWTLAGCIMQLVLCSAVGEESSERHVGVPDELGHRMGLALFSAWPLSVVQGARRLRQQWIPRIRQFYDQPPASVSLRGRRLGFRTSTCDDFSTPPLYNYVFRIPPFLLGFSGS